MISKFDASLNIRDLYDINRENENKKTDLQNRNF